MTVQVLQEDLCHLLLANNWVLKVEQKSTPLQPRSPTTQVWFLQVICFPGREQPYILVGITKISPRVIHLFQSSWAKSVWAPWRALRDNWSSLGSEPRLQVTGNSDRGFAVLSSVPKTALSPPCANRAFGHTNSPGRLAVSCPSTLAAGVQEQMEQRCSRGWIRARLSLGDKWMHQEGAVPELISPAGDRICSAQHPAEALWAICLQTWQTYPCAAAFHRAAGAARATI